MSRTRFPIAPAEKPLVLVGCGILAREVDALIAKNGWQLETHYLASALHNKLDRLYLELDAALQAEERRGRDALVFYGTCHPRLGSLLEQHGTLRTCGQNCIVMLIGFDRFMEELAKGAFFLLEEWALTWEPLITGAFGHNIEVVREIFRASNSFVMGVRTPCSGDFTAAAEAAAKFLDLPLVWMDASLEPLAAVLAEALANKQRQLEERRA